MAPTKKNYRRRMQQRVGGSEEERYSLIEQYINAILSNSRCNNNKMAANYNICDPFQKLKDYCQNNNFSDVCREFKFYYPEKCSLDSNKNSFFCNDMNYGNFYGGRRRKTRSRLHRKTLRRK